MPILLLPSENLLKRFILEQHVDELSGEYPGDSESLG